MMKTGTLQEYNLFINQTREGIEKFIQSYWNDLNKLLDLDHL